jgi:hypothetical protein
MIRRLVLCGRFQADPVNAFDAQAIATMVGFSGGAVSGSGKGESRASAALAGRCGRSSMPRRYRSSQ